MGEQKEGELGYYVSQKSSKCGIAHCSYKFKYNLSKYENYFTIIIMEYIM